MTEKLETKYVIGGASDNNQGGFILGEIQKSLDIIIPEKSKKIEEYLSEYKSWWLILVDYIGHGLREEEFKHITKQNLSKSNFNKLIIISPFNNSNYLDIDL